MWKCVENVLLGKCTISKQSRVMTAFDCEGLAVSSVSLHSLYPSFDTHCAVRVEVNNRIHFNPALWWNKPPGKIIK